MIGESSGPTAGTRGAVVHPDATRRGGSGGDRRLPAARLEEAEGLAHAIGMEIAHAEVVPLPRPRPATLLGKGAVDALAAVVAAESVAVVVVDAQLTAIQQRNLERAWDCKVIDRTGLILEIFGERARTKAGVLQVELAALTYQRSRLVRSWTHLERQRGGLGFVGGPGETQIETDRRLIDERITRIKRQLSEVARTRELHREARRRVPWPVIALVGYTNAGKSTLFNRLTAGGVAAQDQLFATLDPTMRGLPLPSRRHAILSDTVGFVSDLPHELVAAFHATLEEVQEAEVVVHVRDVAHPDSAAQKVDVERVLREELGLGELVEQGRLVEVLNKTDLLEAADHAEVIAAAARDPRAVAVSAIDGSGLEALLELLDHRLNAGRVAARFRLPVTEGRALAWLHDHGEVTERSDDGADLLLTVHLDPADLARFDRRWPDYRVS